MIRTALIGALTATLVACGGSSSTSDTTDSSGDQSNDEGGSDQDVSTPETNNAPYQTGFVLSEIQVELVLTGFTNTVRFETDTQNNTITDNVIASTYSDVNYDDQGRATSVDNQFGNPVTLSYNDDGTVARTELVLDSSVRFVEFEYEAGNLVVRRSGRTENDVTTVSRRYEYEYSTDNALTGANEFLGDNDTPSTIYEFATDANGNVTEVSEFSSAGALSSRSVYTYDGNSNLVRQEQFDDDGVLISIINNVYVVSPELAPNYISLFSALTANREPSGGEIDIL